MVVGRRKFHFASRAQYVPLKTILLQGTSVLKLRTLLLSEILAELFETNLPRVVT